MSGRAGGSDDHVARMPGVDHMSKTNQPVVIMAWFQYWRIECQQCGLLFSGLGGPNLNWSNPAREEPQWFSQILLLARQGAAHLANFVRRPYCSLVYPVAILRLLSMRLHPCAEITPPPTPTHHHFIAELFLPGRSECLPGYPLLPALWAMANFLAEPRTAYARIAGALDWYHRKAVEHWLGEQPDHSPRVMEITNESGQSIFPVYELQQM
jgi:hypothetical protein